jgi:hypothetical protein
VQAALKGCATSFFGAVRTGAWLRINVAGAELPDGVTFIEKEKRTA